MSGLKGGWKELGGEVSRGYLEKGWWEFCVAFAPKERGGPDRRSCHPRRARGAAGAGQTGPTEGAEGPRKSWARPCHCLTLRPTTLSLSFSIWRMGTSLIPSMGSCSESTL